MLPFIGGTVRKAVFDVGRPHPSTVSIFSAPVCSREKASLASVTRVHGNGIVAIRWSWTHCVSTGPGFSLVKRLSICVVHSS